MSFSRSLLISSLWLAGLGSLVAQQARVATVDASELFAKYYRTEAEKTILAAEQEKLAQDPRSAVIAQTVSELRKLEAEVRNTSNSDDSREEFFRKYQMKSHELRSLQRDTNQYRQERQKDINRKLVNISKILLGEVQAAVQRVAAAEGFDMVLDIGGDTSSQVPTLIYIRDSTDITARVLKELNRTKPAPLPPGVTRIPVEPAPPAPAPIPEPVPIPAPVPIPEPVPDPPAPTPPPVVPPVTPSSAPDVPAPVPPEPTPIPRAVPASED